MAKKYHFTAEQSALYPKINTHYETYLYLPTKKREEFLCRLEPGRQSLIRDRWVLDEFEIEQELPNILDKAKRYRERLVKSCANHNYGVQ
jgi:hypothetical protein